jgi:Rv2525c-like, glycoside hydrolase-like domain
LGTATRNTWTRETNVVLVSAVNNLVYIQLMCCLRAIYLSLLLSVSAVLIALPRGSAPAAKQTAYLGFDLNDYPGDDALPVLRKTFSFAGYWLGPPPGEKRTAWLGKRALLQSQGFGFVVLFNGRASRSLKLPADAKQKGNTDGEEAAKLARLEGFPPETIIFLDFEEGGRLSAAYHDYVHAWIDALARHHFRSGAYCSGMPVNDGEGKTITTVQDLQEHLGGRKLVFWVFNDACPPSPGCVFTQTPPAVAQSGSPDASLWQFVQSPRRKQYTATCATTYNADGNCYAPGDSAQKWWIDLDVANSANPSSPRE